MLLLVAHAGKYSDDYHIGMRDLATGAIDLSLHPWTRWTYFWRPVHLAFVFALGTAFWEHDWALRVVAACVHAGVVIMLATWLRRLGLSRRAVAATCVPFLAHPFHSEAVHWFSAVSSALGCVPLLAVFELVRRRAADPAPSSPAHSARRLITIGVLAFVTACIYEMAAAALAAIPLIFFAARPAGISPARSLRTAIAPTIIAGAACVLYAALLIATAPPGQRGSAGMTPSAGELPARLAWMIREWHLFLWGPRGRGVWAGSIIEGWRVLTRGVGWVWLAALLAGAAAMVVAWRAEARDVTRASAPQPPAHLSALLVLIIGLVVFVCAWIPVALVKNNSVELRLWYVPLLGVAIALAGVSHAILRPREQPSTPMLLLRPVLLALVIVAGLTGAIGQVGFQSTFARVWTRDEAQAARLRELLPSPPPGLVVVPIRNNSVAAQSGRFWFDHALQGGLGEPWSATPMVQRALRRRDVLATSMSGWPGRRSAVTAIDDRGVWTNQLADTTLQRGDAGVLIPWDRVLPVIITRRGELLAVRTLVVTRPGVPGDQGTPFDVPLLKDETNAITRAIRATIADPRAP